MPKISEAQREARRREIIEAAWRCFSRRGVQATTIEEIIAESGMSASAMYRYFRDQKDLVRQAIGGSLAELSGLLPPLLEGEGGPAGALARVVTAIGKFSERRGVDLRAMAMQGWALAQHDERVSELIQEHYKAFRHELRLRAARWRAEGECGREASAEEVAEAVFSLVLGYVAQSALLGPVKPGALARGMAALAPPGEERARK